MDRGAGWATVHGVAKHDVDNGSQQLYEVGRVLSPLKGIQWAGALKKQVEAAVG